MTGSGDHLRGGTFSRMPEGDFAYFRFAGQRFISGEGMPLEALTELVTYRELVIDVARTLWRSDHPERQRAPKNYSDQLVLRLDGFEGGSIRPLIRRRESVQTMIDDYFEKGREVVTGAIQSVGAHGTLPVDFPRECVPKLSRFGRSLTAGDRLQFGHPSDGTRRAELNRTTADVLQSIGDELSTELEAASVRGYIVEMDTDTSSFELRASGGDRRRIPGRYRTEDAESVHDWLLLDTDDEGTMVEVTGRVLADTDGEVRRFLGEPTFRVVPMQGILAAFNALAHASQTADLGEAVPAAHLRAVHDRSELLAPHFPRFGIAALPDGVLRVEWTTGASQRSVEIDPDGSLFMHDLDADTGNDAEWEGTLDEQGGAALDNFLRGGELA